MSISTKFLKSSIIKCVVCEKCGRNYSYEMTRSAMGKSSKDPIDKSTAEAEAAEDAQIKLDRMLEQECDLVSCPSCGAITQAMKSQRLKYFGNVFLCMGVGAAILALVFVGACFLHKIFIYPAVAGAGLFLLGGLALFAGAFKMLIPKKGNL